jgi:ferredoxin-NADP reductase
MPILGNATAIVARVTRSTSNALRVELNTPDGTELARAQQKGGAAVLFGFKNGGKSDYTLSSAAGEEFRVAVAGATTITQQDPRPTTPGIIDCCRPPGTNSVSSP